MRSIITFLSMVVVAVMVLPKVAYATDVSGDVSGVWTLAGSPYNVIGEIRVPPGETLVIEPGVQVLFQGHYKFIVDAKAVLSAVGTAQDIILFSTPYPDTGWHGIRFLNASSSSELSYCRLEYGKAIGIPPEDNYGGAIYCVQSNITISNNTITNNFAQRLGGGIFANGSSPTITNNAITGNTSANGAGIFCWQNSQPTISDNTITGNTASDYGEGGGDGGGIHLNGSSPTITNNTISGNSAYPQGGIFAGYGGGIYCAWTSNPSISGNTITGNTASSGAGIAVRYVSDPSISGNTISGNNATNYAGGIYSSYTSNPSISGNTITGNTANSGAGITTVENANPSISGNTIMNNTASSDGGGLTCASSSPTLTNNTIKNNSATYGNGGGIYLTSNSTPSISDNTIRENSAGGHGGGIYNSASSSTITHNTISLNTATSISSGGGGLYINDSNPTLTNNTITGNSAGWDGGGILNNSSNPTITNTILWQNTPGQISNFGTGGATVTYSDVEGGYPGIGNINADPIFINPEMGNYHLQLASPCIDTGDPLSPLDPDGTIVEMGAFYFDQTPTGNIELYPHNTPIIIPPEGGQISFDGWVYNFTENLRRMDIWTMAVLPDGSSFGPIDLYYNVTIPANSGVGMNNILRGVPGGAPAGVYSFVANVGRYPDTIFDSSSFEFTKSGSVEFGATEWKSLSPWFE